MPLRILKKLGEALRDKIAPRSDAQSKPASTGRPPAHRDEPRHREPRRPNRTTDSHQPRQPREATPRQGDSAREPRESTPRQGDSARRPSERRPRRMNEQPQPSAQGPSSRHARGGDRPAPRRDEAPPAREGRQPRRDEAPPAREGRQPRHDDHSRQAPVDHHAPTAPVPAVDAAPWSLDAFPVPVEAGRKRFHDFDLPLDIMHAIADLGFNYCTPIQAASLTQALAGANVAGRAQTGTGKTAAFLVAILSRYLRSPSARADKPATPRALVIAPTRELCVQICNDSQLLGKYCGLRSLAVFGGMDYVRQQRQLADGPVDLLAATPGRLLDFQRQRVVDLSRVDTLVIDEADRMLDMGFIPDVRRILHCLPDKEHRQTLLYSATLSDDVMRLATQWMPDPVKIEIEPDHVASDSIDQKVFIVTAAQKFMLLCNLLKRFKDERVLIFGNRRMSTDRLAIRLRRQGFPCELLSGDVLQNRRMRVLEDFRSGAVKIVVATDVAGRGLHIADIGLVVNFELPYEAEDYVHRIGRTGRAGKVGIAVSFACEDESFQIPEIEKFLGESLKCTQPEEELLQPLPQPLPYTPHSGGQDGPSGSGSSERYAGARRERPSYDRPRENGPRRDGHSGSRPRSVGPHRDDGPRGERPRREDTRPERPPRDDARQPERAPTPSVIPTASSEQPPAPPPRSEPHPDRREQPSAPRREPHPDRREQPSAPRRESHQRRPHEEPVPPARAIPPPSAATQPSHAHAQTWVPGGGGDKQA